MWFEVFFIVCLGFVSADLYQRNRLCVEKQEYIIIWTSTPIIYMFFRRKTFSIKEICIGVFLLYCIICMGRIYKIIKNKRSNISIPKPITYCLKIVFILILYVAVIRNCILNNETDELSKARAVVLFLGISLLFLYAEKIKVWLTGRDIRCLGAAFVLTPVWGFFIIEKTYNPSLGEMEWDYVAGNILWITFLCVVPYCLLAFKKLVLGICLTTCLLFAVGNYYVGRFRGNPIMPADLLSVGTAFQVAGGYVFGVTGQVAEGVNFWYLGIVGLCCIPDNKTEINWKWLAAAGSITAGYCAGQLSTADVESKFDVQLDQFDNSVMYRRNGSVLSFATLLQKLSLDEPEGYSLNKAENILEDNQRESSCESFNPSIIVIMDETFSDLRTLGDFRYSKEYLENWYSIDDYIYKGDLYVSVYGGVTANSEFEFLTGNSMGNCAAGIAPYQYYNMKDIGNLADILNKNGYRATAVHPEYKGNWNRMKTYSNFGFQEFLGINDFVNPLLVRNHISDQSSFEKVINIYEEGNGDRQFIFNVTMQNHGGYNIEDMEGFDIVEVEGNHTDVETYLTLIRESDIAINNLISYFRNIEDPVVLCIFGDHLPALDSKWVYEVMGHGEYDELTLEEMERRYAVPYMIWANYDLSQKKQIMDTSANYLGALLLDVAGIQKTPYMDFLLNMREEIPVYNAFGYKTKDGCWHTLDQMSDSFEWIHDYKIIQYYAMFEPERNMKYFR